MIPYGKEKRKDKIHPHNKCDICGENKISKKSARQQAKKEIQEGIAEFLKNFVENQQDVPEEFVKIVDDHFWDLI